MVRKDGGVLSTPRRNGRLVQIFMTNIVVSPKTFPFKAKKIKDSEKKWQTGSKFHIYCTVELQWLQPLRNHENMFETGVVQANES